MTLRRLLAIVLSGFILLALGTYLAGERTEVVVLRTFDGAGEGKDTKMWIVDYEGKPYVRIGRPGRGWGERLKANPQVELTRGVDHTPRSAVIVTDPGTVDGVAREFSDKYGWVDWWYGAIVRKNPDTVRLDPRQVTRSE